MPFFRKHLAALGTLAFVLILLSWNLGNYGLLEDNEARFFEISYAMAKSGDWLTPKLNGIIHFHKPPLSFWAVASSLNTFGFSEWSGRLPVALASLFLLGATWGFRKNSGLWAVLILVVSLEYWFLSRLVLTDMFLASTVGLTLLSFWRLRDSESKVWPSLFWVSLGASFLSKGPVGLAVVSLTLLGFRLLGGRAPWRRLLYWPGMVLSFVLTAPWYLAACWKYPQLLSYLFFFQTVERVATEVHGRGGPFWFYLPVVMAGFFPWSFSLWVSLRDAWARRDQWDRFLLSWLLGPILLFSISGSKLPTYLLPLFPALALLTARVTESTNSQRQAALSSAVGMALFSLALVIFLHKDPPLELLPAHLDLLLVSAASSVAAAFSFFYCWSNKGEEALLSVGVGFGVVLLILSGALGKCDSSYSSRQLASEILHCGDTGETIIAEYQDHLHGLPYYLNQRLAQVAYPREILFEQDERYKDFLFLSLDDFESRMAGKDFLLILSDSDYENGDFGAYRSRRVGSWVILKSGD